MTLHHRPCHPRCYAQTRLEGMISPRFLRLHLCSVACTSVSYYTLQHAPSILVTSQSRVLFYNQIPWFPQHRREKKAPKWMEIAVLMTLVSVVTPHSLILMAAGSVSRHVTHLGSFKFPKLRQPSVYGHITLKIPVPVRSPKSSSVEPGQYLNG